ncbi:helix-turn-helix transcriptional regulator [Prauserella cavernicola]|uniref:helix-turn-helix transcriptional regulator n=1 Tax=Prauserella cavernicola TaxID=2800127 RepID=UPI0027DCAA49|nr:helix-turn-helix transcriptional regulator [Prauserella cavernicola]
MHLFAEGRPRVAPGGNAKRTTPRRGLPMAETFGQRLRRLRSEAGLSQSQLARMVPISQASLSRYESERQAVAPKLADCRPAPAGADPAVSRRDRREPRRDRPGLGLRRLRISWG